jgi:thiosulfate/3-mercaptopyruvate sulfurtransferase
MLRQVYSRISSTAVTRRFLATQSLGTKRESLVLTPAQVKDLKPATTRILDVTWFMPNSPRNAREEFNQLRVAGAKLLDLDEVAEEHPLGLKHMMPSPQQFKDACGEYLVLFWV